MITQNSGAKPGGRMESVYATRDDAATTPNFCLANVDEEDGYLSCGRKLRKRKDGTEVCSVHGEMH